jgi:hypothetical protein
MSSIGLGGPSSPLREAWPAAVVVLEALSRFVPPETIHAVLTQAGRHNQRIRRLPATAVVWLVIAIGIWTNLDIPAIFRQVVGTLRSLLLVMSANHPPCKAALSQARTRLGACCMRQLFLRTAAPIAVDRTRGAFYKGMRLMAIDGVTFDIPDTPGNAAAFDRPVTRRYGESVDGGYPQIHVTFLSETGTHLIVEAFVKRGKKSEFPLAGALLRKAPRRSLVPWDRGFYGHASLIRAQRRGVHVVGRVGDHVVFERVQTLSDGSYLAVIYPSWKNRRHRVNGMIVRVIDYTLNDPKRPGHDERHRLVTTLLEADAFPATELVVLYHERWEIEIGNDELKTHQLDRLVHLRSRTPCGILQETYGILVAYNAVRFLMHEAALSVDIDPRRLSFIHAVRVLRETAPLLRAAPTVRLPTLYVGMITHIAQGRLPPRDNRINPRVIKKKMSNFPKKRPEHYHVQHPQTSFEQAVRVLK